MTHLPRSGRSLVAVFLLACGGVTACAVDAEDDAPITGDGDGTVANEEEIVSERQLMGSELPDKTLTLTFDDGPGRRTAELADYLAAQGIEGTFFINGNKVPGRQAALDTVAGRGHLVANHTQTHRALTRLSRAEVVREVEETDAVITSVQRGRISALRAPFGAWNGAATSALNGSSMRKYVGSVFWDVGGALTSTAAADWDCWGKGVSVSRCGDLYLQEARRRGRGIVLMHDVHDRTVDLVKYLVPKLQADGFRFARLEDVPSVKRATASAGGPAPTDGCSSATLGRTVAENACVQSRRDETWYRCVAGDWVLASATDARCTSRTGL